MQHAFHVKPAFQAVILALASLASFNTYADVSVFVDNYKTNVAANTTVDTNAAAYMLKGFSDLWVTGSAWNNGVPTAAGAAVLQANQAYVVSVTNNRTSAQETSAYFTDRRNQSYTAIAGLGNLADAFKTASGAFTTISSVAADATVAKYDDKGNGAGLTSSASVGNMVTLVNTLRGNFSSSNPAKNTFNSPRAWRVTDDVAVSPQGTEATGYYTSTLSDGTPNYAAGLTYFPQYQSNVSVLPTLLAARSTTPASDGGFVSGHTNAAYLASFALAYATPEKYQSLLLNASNMGQDRIIAGMHSPLDVIGGRMLATALSAAILSDAANAQLKADALAEGKAFVASNGGTPTLDRFAAYSADTSSVDKANKALFTQRMTYGLPNTNSTTLPAVVPKGAQVLLETRLSYLSADQRREVLRTTAIASGNAVTDDTEGWGRLNLYAAADGYGAFNSNVTVTMNKADGGFSARDAWRNDISGSGGLTKKGTGELALTGNNTYTGNTVVNGGTLVGESASAFGNGNLINNGGTVAINHRDTLVVAGDFTQSAGGTLELDIAKGANYDILSVLGHTNLMGSLNIVFQDGFSTLGNLSLLNSNNYIASFSDVRFTNLSSNYIATLSYSSHGISMNVTAVPEPEAYAMYLIGIASIVMARRRKQNS